MRVPNSGCKETVGFCLGGTADVSLGTTGQDMARRIAEHKQGPGNAPDQQAGLTRGS
jgi:hypothetical protein